MTPERWQRIEGLVEAALQLEVDDRPRFLDDECGTDRELRRRAAAVLRSYDRAESFLEAPAPVPWLAEPGAGDENVSGTLGRSATETIGPYRVLGEIGRGGMGSVFLAIRGDGEYERRVAIKVIRPGIGSESVARRFRAERQILAQLDHPNIAKMLDGGTTGDGRPYVVMELIEGTRIDAYCDRRQTTIRQRLDLFGEICGAVAYAHRNLVVHRDLKPGNILVTEDGVPKLLDFGIAKLLDPSAFPHTVEATASGMGLMTPPYASPEQILGQPVTTASDVYSLGVLLYRLLTGRMPFSRTGLAPMDVQQEPTPPSVAVTMPIEGSATGADAARIAADRRLSLQQLHRRLTGDLDNIVLKALRREPARRYHSVELLAADVERHLDGLPVLARKASLRYRTSKFLRRHRLGIAAAASLAVLGVVSAVQITRQRDRAELERDRAERVSNTLVGFFETLGPEQTTPAGVAARELLGRGADEILLELEDDPRSLATVQVAVGKLYRSLGLYREARPLLENALEVHLELLGDEHLDVAKSMCELALLYSIQGDPRSEGLHLRALEIRENKLGLDHLFVAHSLSGLGDHARARGDYELSISYLSRALKITEMNLGPDHMETTGALANLAYSHQFNMNNEAAEPLLRRALRIREASLGPEHRRLADLLNRLAWIHCERGDYETGRELGRRALRIRESHLGPEHSATATSIETLGYCFANGGDYDQADVFMARAAEIHRISHGENSLQHAIAVQRLGIMKYRKRDYDAAQILFRRALAITDHVAPRHPSRTRAFLFLGRIQKRAGNLQGALELFNKSVALCEELATADRQDRHWTVNQAVVLCDVAGIFRQQGDLEQARVTYLRAVSLFDSIPALQLPQALVAKARALTHLDRIDEARTVVEELHARGWKTPDFLDFSRRYGYRSEAPKPVSQSQERPD